eukprot:1387733-Pleurochrysis_carterae.AAC.1
MCREVLLVLFFYLERKAFGVPTHPVSPIPTCRSSAIKRTSCSFIDHPSHFSCSLSLNLIPTLTPCGRIHFVLVQMAVLDC